MKKSLIIAAFLALVAVNGFSQGTIRYVPNVTGSYTTRIYGQDLIDPLREQHGNPANGIPIGTTVYTGPALAGTGFTATLWAPPNQAANGVSNSVVLVPNTTVGFRTGSAAGLWAEPVNATVIDNWIPGTVPSLLVRVWDNRGGTITSWSQVLAQPNVARGDSGFFDPSGGLGGVDGANIFLTPTLANMRSFNLHVVPEPSLIALGVLGLGALLLRRRK